MARDEPRLSALKWGDLAEFVAITEDAEQPDATEESAAHACNQRLGRYRLCFEVAHGGMATVYLARADGPSGFGKLVASKSITSGGRSRRSASCTMNTTAAQSLFGHCLIPTRPGVTT